MLKKHKYERIIGNDSIEAGDIDMKSNDIQMHAVKQAKNIEILEKLQDYDCGIS